MIITAAEAAESCGARLFGDASAVITKIATDSRDDFSNGGMFVAIEGERVDGHKFISQTVEAGASAVLLSRSSFIPEEVPAGCAYILTDDVGRALLDIGRYCRSRLDIPIVAVTGSVGKTTTREMVAEAISAEKRTFRTKKNFNSQIGLPVTMQSIEDEEIAVLEAGISIPGEMARLASVIRPDVVVMTNIGVAHIEFLGSREGIFEEKFELARALGPEGVLIVNGDDDILGRLEPAAYPFRVIKCGMGPENDVRAEHVVHGRIGSCFTAVLSDRKIPVDLGVIGDHMILNALLALAAADVCGVDAEAAAAKLSAYSGYEGRQRIEEIGGVAWICDYYNASPDSMKAALKVLSDMDCDGKRVAVLGNMYELGPDSPRFHREVGHAAAGSGADVLFTVGENAKEIAAGAAEASGCSGSKDRRAELRIESFDDIDACFEAMKRILRPGDAVLLKASNSMRFGRLRDLWEENASRK
ncbi:MAG: UDP-N-acetylmuramoyl-tripeptide--D-alanyl-D-alanine ligase [Lachnospiraceae bacterium]|nr:UDP-N-acetylmuramoyl-tripeptide--D-alanyl-D-alanine ligase [Lachnospiraceae bacterium]